MAGKLNWNWRSVISFSLLFTMIILFFSGIFLYVSPSGRIARDTGWQILGVDKGGWESIHDLFGFVFIFITLVHIWLNRKALLAYLYDGARKVYRLKAELITALLFTGLVFLVAVLHLLPL